jgi:hypothetical protein
MAEVRAENRIGTGYEASKEIGVYLWKAGISRLWWEHRLPLKLQIIEKR